MSPVLDTPDTEKGPDGQNQQDKVEDAHEYPSGKVVTVIMVALCLAIFLIALDRTIIATAIPRITDHFHSLNDIGWYGSSYLLTSCSFQLLFGRIYTFYPPKWIFLFAIGIFEVGSAICGAAPSSTSFIIGRAIAGLGSCGIFSGAIVIIVDNVAMQKRPMYIGFTGAMFGISSVVAPLLGGAFTDKVSWRWCFYINLPIGAIAILIIILILKTTPPPDVNQASTMRERISQLDPLGTLCFLPGIICLLLALQWGGSTYPWNNGRVIALFVLFGVLLIAFIAVQIWKGDTATVPPRLMKQRSVAAGLFYSMSIGASMMTVIYYLPVWFQAIKNASAIKSGIMNIPLVLSLVLGTIVAGTCVTRFGYYTPFMFLCTAIMSIGAGLLTTFQTTTGHKKWIGYQVLYGFGLGLGMQQASVAAQTVLPKKYVPIGAALMQFGNALGGSMFVSVAQNVFTSRLIDNLVKALPDSGTDIARIVINTGATELHKMIDSKYLPTVLRAYNDAISITFVVALCVSCISIIGAFAMEWKSVKGRK